MTPKEAYGILGQYEEAKQCILDYLTANNIGERIKKIAEELNLAQYRIQYVTRIETVGGVDSENLYVLQEDYYCGCCGPDTTSDLIPAVVLVDIEKGLKIYKDNKVFQVNKRIAEEAVEIKRKAESDENYRRQMYEKLKQEFDNETKGN